MITRQNQKRYRIQKRCFASLNMTNGGATLVALIVSLRASTTCERGKQQARNPDTVDCHEAKASRNDDRDIGYAPLIAAPIPP